MSDEEDMMDEELMLDPNETSGNESMHASASLINPTFRYHDQKMMFYLWVLHLIFFSYYFQEYPKLQNYN